jgi:hypothetical protein
VGYDGTILQSDPLGASPTPIKLESPLKSGDQFSFHFNGQIGQSYQIQVLTDLTQWTLLKTLVCTNPSMPVTDAASPGVKQFYRIFKP